jgi:hypothetical protein
MLKNNKRGDVPITLLVLGIFVVCTLAILTFVRSDMQTKTSFSGIGIMEKANLEIEKENLEHYYLEKEVKKIVPSLSLNWVEKVVIFSVEYNP